MNYSPILAGAKSVLPDAKTGETYYLNISDLLRGYTDPDGHFLDILDTPTVDSGSIETLYYSDEWVLTPSDSNFEGDIVISYTVTDEFGAIPDSGSSPRNVFH